MRVLIVEDDGAVGELLQIFVRGLGHETELVSSAEAALQRLRAPRPDLVLLDLRLPGTRPRCACGSGHSTSCRSPCRSNIYERSWSTSSLTCSRRRASSRGALSTGDDRRACP